MEVMERLIDRKPNKEFPYKGGLTKVWVSPDGYSIQQWLEISGKEIKVTWGIYWKLSQLEVFRKIKMIPLTILKQEFPDIPLENFKVYTEKEFNLDSDDYFLGFEFEEVK